MTYLVRTSLTAESTSRGEHLETLGWARYKVMHSWLFPSWSSPEGGMWARSTLSVALLYSRHLSWSLRNLSKLLQEGSIWDRSGVTRCHCDLQSHSTWGREQTDTEFLEGHKGSRHIMAHAHTLSSLWEGKESQCVWSMTLSRLSSASYGTGNRRAPSSRNWHVPNMRGFVGSQGGRGHRTHHDKARRARHVQTFVWPVSTEPPEPIPTHAFIVYPRIHSSILSPTHYPSTHSSHPVCQLILGNHYVQSPGRNTSKKILTIKGIILFTIYTYIPHVYICIYTIHI